MKFLDSPTRNLFFTGKGGVGKTSMACIAAVALADQGKSVLLVSTDPASNLDEVLGTPLSNHPIGVVGVDQLQAMNINPEQAAADYRNRMTAPYRGILPDAVLQSMEEQFSGSCTLEIAAFDEFAKLLGDPNATNDFDHVVFDTAPTGHTLRLLNLPTAWSGFMDENTSGMSCLGPLAGLQAQQTIYRATVRTLADEEQTTLVLVTRPESSALLEAKRTSSELRDLGMKNQHLVINGVFTATDPTDELAEAMEHRCTSALADIPSELSALQRTSVPLAPHSLVGIQALRDFDRNYERPNGGNEGSVAVTPSDDPTRCSLSELVDQLAQQTSGVVLTMGKGGVGKTSLAAAVAVALAEKGLRVRLSTTDPAAHLSATLQDEQIDGLTVQRIDPAQVTAEYQTEVIRTAGSKLDAAGKTLLEEDLRSPCTEEIAVFRAFAEAISGGQDEWVVLDTAPTGHTILLLDSALNHHREVNRQASQMPDAVVNLLPRLRDPDYTRVLVVTLPETTPVHEAATLQQDLRRAEIEPFAWIVNQSLLFHESSDPVMVGRQRCEQPLIKEIATKHAERTVIIPWLKLPPRGLDGLHELVNASELKPTFMNGRGHTA